MTFRKKVKPYVLLELDLATARTSGEQGALTIEGVSVDDWIANTITILDDDGGVFSFALSQDGDDITGVTNLKCEGVVFTDILWTNVAQAGITPKIFIAWVD